MSSKKIANDNAALLSQAQATKPRSPRFNTLQAMRFVAAFCVVVYHSSYYIKVQGLRAGAFLQTFSDPSLTYGVYLFFAISGFVLTQALERSSIAEFLAHRFLRIYPAFWGAVLFVALLRWTLFDETPTLSWRALSLLPFGVIPYPLGVEWSLIYEIFFYLILTTLSQLRKHWLFNLAMAGWAGLILAGYFVGGWSFTVPLPTWSMLPFSLMNLTFIAGVVAYQIYSRVTRFRWWLLPLAIVALCLARTNYDPLLTFAGLAFGCGALVVWAAAQSTVFDLAAASPFVKLGNYSYGLYLLHVPLILLILRLPITTHLPTWLLFIGIVFLSVIMGSAFGAAELRLYQSLKQFAVLKQRA